jgi:Tfp pilus assembly protein PilX
MNSKKYVRKNTQTGAVLVVALLMLLVLTTLGVATINSTNTNLQIVQNQQRQQETAQVAENAINHLLSNIDYFVNNSAYLNTNGDFTLSFPSDVSSGMNVTVNDLQCLLQAPAKGCSLVVGNSASCHPEYYWQANVSVVDSSSGASTTFIEGFKFKYLAGYCPV